MPSRPDPPPPRVPDRCYTLGICGGVAERTNATVLKFDAYDPKASQHVPFRI